MAEAVYEGRKAIRDQYTPALEAAAAIARRDPRRRRPDAARL